MQRNRSSRHGYSPVTLQGPLGWPTNLSKLVAFAFWFIPFLVSTVSVQSWGYSGLFFFAIEKEKKEPVPSVKRAGCSIWGFFFFCFISFTFFLFRTVLILGFVFLSFLDVLFLFSKLSELIKVKRPRRHVSFPGFQFLADFDWNFT